MNRRSFIKTITGFAAGVVAAFVPKAKGIEPSGCPGSHSPSISASCSDCFNNGDCASCPLHQKRSGFNSPIKDIASYNDDLFVLLENGELWNISNCNDKKLVSINWDLFHRSRNERT